jgi:hypothetical protein
MCRWQAKRLGDVDYHRTGAILEGHVRKLREVMIGRSRYLSRPRCTPGIIAAPLSRRLLARAAVIRKLSTADVRNVRWTSFHGTISTRA